MPISALIASAALLVPPWIFQAAAFAATGAVGQVQPSPQSLTFENLVIASTFHRKSSPARRSSGAIWGKARAVAVLNSSVHLEGASCTNGSGGPLVVFCDTALWQIGSGTLMTVTIDVWACCGTHTFSAALSGSAGGSMFCSGSQYGSGGDMAGTCQDTLTWNGNNGYDTIQVSDNYCDSSGCTLYQGPPVVFFLFSSAPPRNQTIGSACAGRVKAGDPVNIVTGEYDEKFQDFSMSGPFGLQLRRYYRSQSGFTGMLGTGWRTNFDEVLDTTGISSGIVTYFDCHGDQEVFYGVAAGTPVRNPVSGDMLTLNQAGTVYSLVTWANQTLAFDSVGRLSSLTDRIGNTQILNRDPSSHLIQTVTDTLGRQLSFSYDASSRLISVHSVPAGITVGFGYTGTNCGTGNLCSATEPDGKTWTYQYDITSSFPHNLTAIVDPLGHTVVQNSYNSNQVNAQSIGGQDALSFSYFPTSFPTNTVINDSLGRSTTFVYDKNSEAITFITGPLCSCSGAQSLTLAYDQFLRLTSITDGNNHITTLKYGRDVIQMFPDGSSQVQTAYPTPSEVDEPLTATATRAITASYYAAGDPRQDLIQTLTIPSADTPANSKVVTFNFNTQGLLTSLVDGGYVNGAPTSYTTSYSYDAKGRIQQITGPRTDLTQHTNFGYFPDTDTDLARRGQVQTITDALSHVTHFASDASPNNTYTLFGDPLSMTDPNAVVTDYAYDGQGRMLSQTMKGVPGDTAPLTTTWAYDGVGRLGSVTLSLGNGVSLAYDAAYRLTNLVRFATGTKNQQEQLLVGYDGMSQLTSEQAQLCPSPAATCAAWTTTQQENFEYDGYGRLSSVDHPIPTGSKIFYGYDAAGNLTTIRDENHTSTNATYGYDFANRLLSIVQTLSGAPGNQITTQYGYDVQDNAVSVIDPNNNHTTYHADDFGRVTSQVSPVGGTTSYSYDPADNLVNVVDANSAQTASTYDALDRILSAVSTRTGYTTETVNWTYDSATSGNFGTGRLASITDPSGSTGYAYERRGLLKSEARTILGNAYSLAYTFDKNGNQNQLTYPDAKVITFGFDFADRPISAKRGSTTYVSSATYEPFGPLSTIAFGNSATQTLSYDLRYRPSENKLVKGSTLADYLYQEDAVGNITQIHDALTAGYNRDFGYDDLNRLTTANSGTSLWGTTTGNGYTYDAMGNLTSLQLGAGRLASFAYSGTLPKLTSVTENSSNRPVSYDSAGNETQVGSAAYTYTPRNLLASGDGLSYASDGWNRRTVTSGISGSKTRYSFYDPTMNLIAESALTTSGKPAIAFDYIWFGGRPVAQLDSGGAHYTFADHLGTPLAQTNSSGTISYQAEYEPYGKVFALRSGDVHQPLRLPGQVAEQFDASANGATERSYNNFRWYRPGWGRYSQAGPFGVVADPNVYGYAFGNPTTIGDRFGLRPGELYQTPGEAAIQAMLDLVQSFAIGARNGKIEWAGRIYFDLMSNCYAYTPPVFGSASGVERKDLRLLPPFTANRGFYHNHPSSGGMAKNINLGEWPYNALPHEPGPQPNNNDEYFSPQDLDISIYEHQPAYVIPPSGLIKQFTPNGNGPNFDNLPNYLGTGNVMVIWKKGDNAPQPDCYCSHG